MRILVVSPQLPVASLGGLGLQLHHLVHALESKHEMTIVGFRPRSAVEVDCPGETVIEVTPPARDPGARVRAWAGATRDGIPLAARVSRQPIADAVSSLMQKRRFDVAHVASSILAGVAPALGATPGILAALDAWHLNARVNRRLAPPLVRPLYALEERRIRRFEARALRPYSAVVVVSAEDAAALQALDPGLNVEVVPNGVDTQLFAPRGGGEPQQGHIVFSGTMSWGPNVEAARFLVEDVLPLVHEARPDAHLSIVGRAPAAGVVKLARSGVRVTGEVADMRDSLWSAQVYACPMVSGTGIKNKLLEAMACGAPAVATQLACQGMAVGHGQELLIADSAEDFAAALVSVLGSADLRRRLAEAARRYVVERHGWDAVADAYEALYASAAAERSG